MKYCVYTRAFFENSYIACFIQHYINLGFDKIIILHSGGVPYNVSEDMKKKVDIYYVKNMADSLLDKYKYLIQNSEYDWILSVDMDELLLLNKKYNTIHDYVEEKLLNHGEINAFYFRWGMIEKFETEPNNFKKILKKYKIFSNPHIKTMFKKIDLINIFYSHYAELNKLTIYFENTIFKKNQAIIPTNEKSYKETMLIHLHTRNIHDLIIKSLNTLFDGKKMNTKNGFVDFINLQQYSHDVVNQFINCIGAKAELPFVHCQSTTVSMDDYDVSKYDYNIASYEKGMLHFLIENNINVDYYSDFTNQFIEKVKNDKTFLNE